MDEGIDPLFCMKSKIERHKGKGWQAMNAHVNVAMVQGNKPTLPSRNTYVNIVKILSFNGLWYVFFPISYFNVYVQICN
jgi:hypothetical protein